MDLLTEPRVFEQGEHLYVLHDREHEINQYISVIEKRSKVNGDLINSWSDEDTYLYVCTVDKKRIYCIRSVRGKDLFLIFSHDLKLEKE